MPHRSTILQWSRISLDAEGRHCSGDRSCASSKLQWSRISLDAEGAPPRSAPRSPAAASMEPHLIRCGRIDVVQFAAKRATQLQWSRISLDAEGWASRRAEAWPTSLQWSRISLDAEGCAEVLRGLRPLHRASMEPHLIRCGRQDDAEQTIAAIKASMEPHLIRCGRYGAEPSGVVAPDGLQWSRISLDAEGRCLSTRMQRTRGVASMEPHLIRCGRGQS